MFSMIKIITIKIMGLVYFPHTSFLYWDFPPFSFKIFSMAYIKCVTKM